MADDAVSKKALPEGESHRDWFVIALSEVPQGIFQATRYV